LERAEEAPAFSRTVLQGAKQPWRKEKNRLASGKSWKVLEKKDAVKVLGQSF
jgi:hypothetical protein